MKKLSLFFTVFFFAVAGLYAQNHYPKKSGYFFFNPVPSDEMREQTTDIVGRTLSPFTIDAGHLQLESELVSIHFREIQGTTYLTHFEVLNNTVKYGLTNFLDVQFYFNTAIFERNKPIGDPQYHFEPEYFQHMGARVKVNFFGNDYERISIGAMGYYHWLRYGNSDDPLAGIAIPASFTINPTFTVSGMLAFGNETNNAFTQHMAKLDIQLSEQFSTWFEIFSSSTWQPELPAPNTINFGIVQRAFDDYLFTAGAHVGINVPADRYRLTAGIAARF